MVVAIIAGVLVALAVIAVLGIAGSAHNAVERLEGIELAARQATGAMVRQAEATEAIAAALEDWRRHDVPGRTDEQ